MKPLIIFMTRRQGESEWQEMWGFREASFMAFIGQGSLRIVEAKQIPEAVNDHVHDDVWVINGKKYGDHSDALDAIPWSQLGRDFVFRVHMGGARRVGDKQWNESLEKERRDNLRHLLEKAQGYSSKNVELFSAIKKYAAADKTAPREYQEALRQLCEALGEEVPRIQYAIELLEMFLPLDVQLQLKADDCAGCRGEAEQLEQFRPRAAWLLSRITKREVSPEQLEPGATGAGETAGGAPEGDAVALTESLLASVRRVKNARTRAEMLEIFGLPPGAGGASVRLDDSGFHRRYESLRDALLKLVEGD